VKRREAPEGRVEIAGSLEEAVRNAFWIQENAPESLTLKADLYRQIEAAADAGAVLASSTSSLTWSDLAGELRARDRFITAHPFNPPHLMPLVEVFAPSEERKAQARAFYDGLERKTDFLKRDVPRHIANR